MQEEKRKENGKKIDTKRKRRKSLLKKGRETRMGDEVKCKSNRLTGKEKTDREPERDIKRPLHGEELKAV